MTTPLSSYSGVNSALFAQSSSGLSDSPKPQSSVKREFDKLKVRASSLQLNLSDEELKARAEILASDGEEELMIDEINNVFGKACGVTQEIMDIYTRVQSDSRNRNKSDMEIASEFIKFASTKEDEFKLGSGQFLLEKFGTKYKKEAFTLFSSVIQSRDQDLAAVANFGCGYVIESNHSEKEDVEAIRFYEQCLIKLHEQCFKQICAASAATELKEPKHDIISLISRKILQRIDFLKYRPLANATRLVNNSLSLYLRKCPNEDKKQWEGNLHSCLEQWRKKRQEFIRTNPLSIFNMSIDNVDDDSKLQYVARLRLVQPDCLLKKAIKICWDIITVKNNAQSVKNQAYDVMCSIYANGLEAKSSEEAAILKQCSAEAIPLKSPQELDHAVQLYDANIALERLQKAKEEFLHTYRVDQSRDLQKIRGDYETNIKAYEVFIKYLQGAEISFSMLEGALLTLEFVATYVSKASSKRGRFYQEAVSVTLEGLQASLLAIDDVETFLIHPNSLTPSALNS